MAKGVISVWEHEFQSKFIGSSHGSVESDHLTLKHPNSAILTSFHPRLTLISSSFHPHFTPTRPQLWELSDTFKSFQLIILLVFYS